MCVEIKTEYNNRIQCATFIFHIEQVIRKEIISEIKNKLVYCSMLQLIKKVLKILLFLWHFFYYCVQYIFLSIVPLDCATTDGFFETIKHELNNLAISQLLYDNQLIGISTDGTANMMTVQNGFDQKVRQNLNHLTGVYCVDYI